MEFRLKSVERWKMFPNPWLMIAARTGRSIAEMEHAERDYYAQDIEKYSKTFKDECEKLRAEFDELEQQAGLVEDERNQLRSQMQTLLEYCEIFTAAVDSFVEEFLKLEGDSEKMIPELEKKLEAFEAAKRMLTLLSSNSALVFSSEFAARHLDKLSQFVDELP
jgi:chromosome segregation ATPase